MTPLPVSPLPSARADDARGPLQSEQQYFVDDEAVLSLLTSPFPPARPQPNHMDLALSSSEDDFAGWAMPVVSSPFRALAEATPSVAAPRNAPPPVRRKPQPPQLHDTGIGAAHTGSSHRWWLACVTGIITSLLLACLFLTLAKHSSAPSAGGIFSKRIYVPAAPAPAPSAMRNAPADGSPVARLTP